MITIHLSKKLDRRVTKFAKRTGQSKTSLVRKAVFAQIGNLEHL
jgi:predicted DNA-binding protein